MNSLKNITVPLSANLNMNRNKSLTCSSYDILNGINAPVFGGSISPLHYWIDFQGDAKYSVDGERWTMDSNKLYRGGLLFKDFSGEYTFDMVDTGLDMDAMTPLGTSFIGVKTTLNSVETSTIDSNFNITSSSTIASFDMTSEVFRGFKLAERDGTVYLLIGSEYTSNMESPERLRIFVWNGSSFELRSDVLFSFTRMVTATTWEKSSYNVGTSVISNWFFTVSKKMTNDILGISVFKNRPNGVNTFSQVWEASFKCNHGGQNGAQIVLMSGPDTDCTVYTDTSGGHNEGRHNLLAFFVDNMYMVMGLGHNPDTNSWSWVRMFSHAVSLSQNGTYDGCGIYYPVSSAAASFSGMYVESGKFNFAEISKPGTSCLTVNSNGYARLVIAGFGNVDSSNGSSAPVVNVTYDSLFFNSGTRNGQTYADCYGLFNAGVTSNASLPTTEDGWNTLWEERKYTTKTAWNPSGSRYSIGNNFYTLCNGREGNLAGISYSSNSNKVGTLLTAWGGVVPTFEPISSSEKVIYKDGFSNTVKYIQKRSNITLDDIDIVGRYVLVRCTADENIYDINSGKWEKFSNDWNNRLFFGYVNIQKRDVSGSAFENQTYTYKRDTALTQYSDSWQTSGSIAAGYDVAFQKEKGFAPSRLYNYTSLSGIVLGQVNAFGYELTSENGLDVFASSGTSAPAYKTTLFGNSVSSSVSNLAGSVYPITSSGSAYFNIPIIESTIVDSYNGKYGLKIDGSVYTIAYDGIRPIALYNTSSIVDQVDDFFIVQSQYYALIKGYICSLSYSSSNVISGVEQIVNVQGMKFIGAFPSCAYFYSPSARAIFAFTGDADLQLFVQTDRITEVYNSKYYPNCEWIFMSTNDGTYVMTQNNTFRMDAMRVKRFFPTDDEYCVLVLDNETNDNIFLSMNRYSGWSTMPVVLETSFFGEGDMKKSTITDWYIRVFKGDEDYNGTVKCSAKTITDVVSQAVKTFDGTKEEKLTKDKFDSNDNAMITFHTGCNALGTSCKVISDYPICYFGFSIGSDGSTNKSKLNI